MALTRQVLECFLRLNSPEFDPLRKWVAERREEERDKCETFEGTNAARAQGKAQAFGELKSLIEGARTILEKQTSSRP